MQSQLQYLHKSDWSFLIYFSSTLTEVLQYSYVSTEAISRKYWNELR